MRPLFKRNLKLKTGQDLLNLFDQVRRNIQLNKRSQKDLDEEQQKLKLDQIKSEYLNELLGDLIEAKAYSVAQIVYSEKQKATKEMNVQDKLQGLSILANQLKQTEFDSIFEEITSTQQAQIGSNELTQLLTLLSLFPMQDMDSYSYKNTIKLYKMAE